jgi:(E)-4-hydroxy-3-methylbut-2-enyl-diphosphate synthase
MTCAGDAAQIRINPGNFVDGRKSFDVINYDDPRVRRCAAELLSG